MGLLGIYIFGGGMAGSQALPDAQVYCLDLGIIQMHTHDSCQFDLDSLFWVCVSMDSTLENRPSPRLGHSLTSYKNYMYVLGGMDNSTMFNNVWKFDLGTFMLFFNLQ